MIAYNFYHGRFERFIGDMIAHSFINILERNDDSNFDLTSIIYISIIFLRGPSEEKSTNAYLGPKTLLQIIRYMFCMIYRILKAI